MSTHSPSPAPSRSLSAEDEEALCLSPPRRSLTPEFAISDPIPEGIEVSFELELDEDEGQHDHEDEHEQEAESGSASASRSSRYSSGTTTDISGALSCSSSYPSTPSPITFYTSRDPDTPIELGFSFIDIPSPTHSAFADHQSEDIDPEATPRAGIRTSTIVKKRTSAPDVMEAVESYRAARRATSVGATSGRRRSGIDIPRGRDAGWDVGEWRQKGMQRRNSVSSGSGDSGSGSIIITHTHTRGRRLYPSGPNSPSSRPDSLSSLHLVNHNSPVARHSRDRVVSGLSGVWTGTDDTCTTITSVLGADLTTATTATAATATRTAARNSVIVPESQVDVSAGTLGSLSRPDDSPIDPVFYHHRPIHHTQQKQSPIPEHTPTTPSPVESSFSDILFTPCDQEHTKLSPSASATTTTKGSPFASFPAPPPREATPSPGCPSLLPSLPISAGALLSTSSSASTTPLPSQSPHRGTKESMSQDHTGRWVAHTTKHESPDHTHRPPPAFTHQKIPSLPSSSVTASTSTLPVETPTYSSTGGSRRLSKFTAFSGSSASSLYSSDTDSLRDQRHYRVTEHPDISTVFEEGSSLEVERKPTVNRPSQSTLNNNPPAQRTHGRTGTVSSVNSGRSNKSVHPFAAVIHRAPSPPASNNPISTYARPTSPHLSSSRSQPNFSEVARMHYAPAHQVTMVGEGDDDDEEKCPICVESLSFSYRLPGEKPHVVPECGHALHEECFVTVYGEVPTYGSKRNIGLCGVCRQKMRIVDGGGERKRSKGKKLDMLMGATSTPPLRAIPSYPSLSSYQSPSSPSDPYGDDPVDLAQITSSSRSFVGESQPKVVVPTISIRAEFASTTRRQNKPTTAMVTIEVPHAGDRGRYPATRMIDSLRSPSMMNSPRLPGSPGSFASHDITHSPKSGPSAAPFSHVEAELKHRVLDYKNSGLDTLGPLRLYDMIAVRKGSMLREFLMYLYNDALICISEEKPNAFQKIFSSSSSMRSTDTKSSTGTGSGRGPLKLRGRIYVKHVKKLVDSSVPSEFSITILMENEGMESFILTFKDKGSHETWRCTLQQIVDEAKQPATSAKGGNSANKIARLMGSGAPPPAPGGSSRGGKAATTPGLPSSSSMGFGPTFSDFGSPSTVDQHSPDSRPSAGDLVNNAPLAPIHTPLDLVIVLSIPASPPGASAPLKLRLMRQSLAFVFALLGSKDRVSIVSCEMGTSIRKTPLLNPTKYESRRRLEEFVEAIGAGSTPGDESEVQTQPDERCDVVTAINVSLDVILQRKAKNPLTGLILISDTNEVAKRAQMDLVCARLDAANVPVHSLGYGKAHDPTPLWMVSNHTQGTYTFVREWYHLRDALAGVIGGLMTIALTNMKLHLSAQENEFRIVKVTGTPQAIGSASGKTLDIELKELRFGERREILVEVELIGDGSSRNSGESGDGSRPGPRRSPSLINGMDSMSVGDANSALREMVYEESMVDEVPVIEVDCSFHDPAIGRSVSRLAHPVLLTLAILPTLSSPGNQYSDPTVQRRKMELIASDMLTRSLLLVSRRNFSQANKLLGETRKIVRTISEGIQGNIPAGGKARTKKEVASVQAVAQLDNIVGDMDALCEALDENPELFGKDQRNFASQQGIVLRSQRSWTTKTGTEAWYCTDDVRRIIQISGEWGVKG